MVYIAAFRVILRFSALAGAASVTDMINGGVSLAVPRGRQVSEQTALVLPGCLAGRDIFAAEYYPAKAGVKI